MEQFVELITDPSACPAQAERMVLTYGQREKARQRIRLGSGEEIAINIRRGTVMRGGDWLRAPSGRCLVVVAAGEKVSTVVCEDSLRLTTIAYHLGNRHVSLQIGAGWLRYLHDHVLDDMVRGLGGTVNVETQPFEPESGAYGGHAHHHH